MKCVWYQRGKQKHWRWDGQHSFLNTECVCVQTRSWTVLCSTTWSQFRRELAQSCFLHLREGSHSTQIFSCASFFLSFTGWIVHPLTGGTVVTSFNILHRSSLSYSSAQCASQSAAASFIQKQNSPFPAGNSTNSVGSPHGSHVVTVGSFQTVKILSEHEPKCWWTPNESEELRCKKR